jgi:ATP-dependent helicase/nuclease subunit A
MIQGVIDLYFLEGDELVLVDYKTDYLQGQDASTLIERYGLQLDYYKQALERITGKPVKETIIYSFYLGRSLELCQ